MTYEQWLRSVPPEITDDPLWQMKVYRLALFASDLGWVDVSRLMRDRRVQGLADQLYRALGSIGANIAEGYSRRSRKDRARFYEYALGSAREARTWYYQGRHVLPEAIVSHRLRLLTDIVRLLLTIIPRERDWGVAEEGAIYQIGAAPPSDSLDEDLTHLLNNVPMP
ncbi:MAG TPA: four helix bundle protein [Chloroflexi bacterium]|nr:four helix bundle protein [Chloroflexota bacterium]